MYERKSTYVLWAIISVIIAAALLGGCNLIDTDVRFFVSGSFETELDITGVTILVNDSPRDERVAADGTFMLTNLKSGDVVTFQRKGLVFESYTVKNADISGLIISPKLKKYTITASSQNGVITGAGEYDYGTQVTLTMTANTHYEFQGLFEGETKITDDTTYTFAAEDDRNFTAVFNKKLYPISFSKNLLSGTASCPESAAFGDEIVLDADDNDNCVFVKWVVNGVEITDKHHQFALDTTTPTISAVFLQRTDKPSLSISNYEISISDADAADEFKLYLDGAYFKTQTSRTLSADALNLYSGSHEIKVVAVAAGYAPSLEAVLNFTYIRPIDAPKNVGVLSTDEGRFFVFSKVLAAADYTLFVNGEGIKLSSCVYAENDNEIRVNLSSVITVGGEYSVAVSATAYEGGRDSKKSAAVAVTYVPALSKPSAQISGNLLSWSHEREGVAFDIAVNGVVILSASGAGRLDLSGCVEGDEAVVTVVARLSGYESSEITVNYTKGE